MKKPNNWPWFAVAALLAVLAFLLRGRIHFDWAMFWQQLRHVAIVPIVVGIALIYATYWLRSVRWAVLLAPTKKVGVFSTVGSQFIGFTAVALFGRLADLTRPYLIAKRVQLSLGSQVAVYTIERMFDLAGAAVIFSAALAFAPRGLPHHEIFVRTGLVSLAGTAFLAVFAFAVRSFGEAVARLARSLVGMVSASAAEVVAERILEFRHGLQTLASVPQFLTTLGISVLMWAMIGLAYVETLHAFVETPQLATIGFSATMLLMGASIGGSLLQLPVLGWFTQIAVTAAAMRTFYGAPIESATACGALLLIVTSLSIVPMGFVFAQLERVSLKDAAEASEAAALEA